MLGLMQDKPLLISSLIEHAAAFHPETEIVSRFVEDPADAPPRRCNYRTLLQRSKQVANLLTGQFGIAAGSRVGTLAWNTTRHMELYFGISGSGAVLHTINPRLAGDQLAYVVNHAEDKVLMFDISFAKAVEKLAPSLSTVEHYVALTDREHLPDIDVPGGLLCYEDIITAQASDYQWPQFDETSASSLCYTSGTTGNPKGVLYSHRSTVLHTLMAISPDCFNLSARSSMLVVVPMFHANAWGMIYAAAMVGAKVVLPGEDMRPQHVVQLMRDERISFSPGVPTVWLMLTDYLEKNPEQAEGLCVETLGIGGAAPPMAMIHRLRERYGIEVVQGWGMTETSPIGVINRLLPKHEALSEEEREKIRVKAGRGVWGVHLKIVDDAGKALPFDGHSQGEVWIRGPWIASGYYRAEGGSKLDDEGYLPTGDIGIIDNDGYLQLVDRAKDVVKSGGEWISSVELENAAYSHPGVAEAAVIGIAHPKWQERPLMVIVKKPGAEVTHEALLEHLRGQVARWWLPDDIVFVDELPHTATGKVRKLTLRQQYKDYQPRQ